MRFSMTLSLVWALSAAGTSVGWADALKGVSVSADAAMVAAGGSDGKVYVWDLKSASRTAMLDVGTPVTAVGFIRDAGTLAVGTSGAGVQVWTMKQGRFERREHLAGDKIVYILALSPNQSELAVGMHGGSTMLFETKTWRQVAALFEPSNLTCGLCFAPDGATLASAGNSFSAWDVGPSSPLRVGDKDLQIGQVEERSRKALRRQYRADGRPGIDPYCADVAFSPDGKHLAGVTGVSRLDTGGGSLRAWDAKSADVLWTAHAAGMICLTCMADGKSMVTGSDDGTLRLWDSARGELQRTWKGHAKSVRQIVRLPKQTRFVSAGDDGVVRLWSTDNEHAQREFTTGARQ